MNPPGKLRALLATLRIANAPSVVSNVWLGVVLGFFASSLPENGLVRPAVLPVLSGLLLYFAGNLANDWFDREWDRTRRPERGLPAGLFQARTYLAAALMCAVLGLVAAFSAGAPCGFAAVFILACITLYTWIHKRTAWSVLPMGLCRAGLYLLGLLSSLSWDRWARLVKNLGMEGTLLLVGVVVSLCVGLLAYIAGLSMSARYEGMADAPPGPKVIARSLLALPLVAMPCWMMLVAPKFGWIGMIPFGIWLALCLTCLRRPISNHVSALLAGIPLVDAIFLLPLGIGIAIDSSSRDSVGIAIALVPLVAFILGRLLQKVAPAT